MNQAQAKSVGRPEAGSLAVSLPRLQGCLQNGPVGKSRHKAADAKLKAAFSKLCPNENRRCKEHRGSVNPHTHTARRS